MIQCSRRDFLRGFAVTMGTLAVGCAPAGAEPMTIDVPEGFDGTQFDLFRRFTGKNPEVETEFFIYASTGWLRPSAADFWTLDAGEWRQARDGDEGENAWLFYPLPGEKILFSPIEA